jgi:enoyl-CoA hydratase/carnithine racemase
MEPRAMTEDAGTTPLLSREGAVATIRLNRPRYRNRIEPADLAALQDLLDEVEATPAVRVLVLTGTGKAFSSGYHLGDLAARGRAAGPDDDPSRPPAFEALANRIEDLAVPTICRLNGGVYGGSTDLALSCDFRIGVDSAEMFMPAARLGIHYYPGGMLRFVSRLGPAGAKRLFLTADRIDAAEMLRIGYLTEMVPAARLDARVAELAATLAGNAPRALRGMKRSINEIARGGFDRAAGAARYRDSLLGDEIKEGLRAYAEKRPPRHAD